MCPSLRQREPTELETMSLRSSPRNPPRTRNRMNPRTAPSSALTVPEQPPQRIRTASNKPRSKPATNTAERTRRRKRTPTPESESESESDDDQAMRSRSASRSRSLSVIPTVHMPPITLPAPDDAAVRALGLAQSARPGTEVLTLTRDDIARMREGHLPPRCPIRQTKERRNWKNLTLSEAAWARLEEGGGATKGRSWTTREGCDEEGEPVKPDLPYVMLTKLVIASSPRKMLTLNQIYHAMEERWPYFRTVGQTFRNSIRHSLSMNSAFVNVERPLSEGGMGTGKGGYWRVSEDTTTSHRGRTKKPRIEVAENTYPPVKPKGAGGRYPRIPTPRKQSPAYRSPGPGIEQSPPSYQFFKPIDPPSPHRRPTRIDLPNHTFEPSFVRHEPYPSGSQHSMLPTPPYDDCGPLMQLANIALPNSPVPAPTLAPPSAPATAPRDRIYPLPPIRQEQRPPSFAHLLNPPLSPDSGPPSPSPFGR